MVTFKVIFLLKKDSIVGAILRIFRKLSQQLFSGTPWSKCLCTCFISFNKRQYFNKNCIQQVKLKLLLRGCSYGGELVRLGGLAHLDENIKI